ncbi:unnamed protein product, partial [marine sediment metagenome]
MVFLALTASRYDPRAQGARTGGLSGAVGASSPLEDAVCPFGKRAKPRFSRAEWGPTAPR